MHFWWAQGCHTTENMHKSQQYNTQKLIHLLSPEDSIKTYNCILLIKNILPSHAILYIGNQVTISESYYVSCFWVEKTVMLFGSSTLAILQPFNCAL